MVSANQYSRLLAFQLTKRLLPLIPGAEDRKRLSADKAPQRPPKKIQVSPRYWTLRAQMAANGSARVSPSCPALPTWLPAPASACTATTGQKTQESSTWIGSRVRLAVRGVSGSLLRRDPLVEFSTSAEQNFNIFKKLFHLSRCPQGPCKLQLKDPPDSGRTPWGAPCLTVIL